MNRIDVVNLVVDLVDADLVDLSDRPSVLPTDRPICFKFCLFCQILKSSFNALGGLYRPDRHGFLGTVSYNSL